MDEMHRPLIVQQGGVHGLGHLASECKDPIVIEFVSTALISLVLDEASSSNTVEQAGRIALDALKRCKKALGKEVPVELATQLKQAIDKLKLEVEQTVTATSMLSSAIASLSWDS